MKKLVWIDGHLDLGFLALGGRDLREADLDPAVGCVTLPALRNSGVEAVFGTIFTMPSGGQADHATTFPRDDSEAAWKVAVRQLDVYRRLEEEGEIRIVCCRDQLKETASELKVILLMEGADPIRSPEDAAWWHERGVRMVGLTWKHRNRYAGGNEEHGPLSPEGVDLVAALDDLGIVHDASHLCDESFDCLLGARTGPVVATHSNSRSVFGEDNQRHLTDSQIRAISELGGVVGLNLLSLLLVPEGRATIDDCVAHVSHVSEVMGHRGGVALGSDADGGIPPDGLAEGLDSPTKWHTLAAALRESGWTDEQIDGFSHGNWRTFLERTLPV